MTTSTSGPVSGPGAKTYPRLPVPADGPGGRRQRRVCIVSNGVLGPVRNGGISTLYMGLAEVLVAAGHEVTYLYTGGTWTEGEPVSTWVGRYRERGINLVPLPEIDVPIQYYYNPRVSYATYLWLREHDHFDVIHFHEWQGHGFFSLRAKRLGLAFTRTPLCVSTHSPTSWNRIGNFEYMDRDDDLVTDFLERRSLQLADVVVSSSQHMYHWLTEQGWVVPENSYVQPNVLPPSALETLLAGREISHDTGKKPVNEFVFFGRLEGRKGLTLFCDAIERLAETATEPFTVTFLGKYGTLEGRPVHEFLNERSLRWPFRWTSIIHFDNVQAVEYLSQPGRVAVLPSLMDNSPLAIHECLLAGVPFLATDVGGIPELIHTDDHGSVLFPPRPAALAARLGEVLREGLATARPSFDEAESRAQWVTWHEGLTPVELAEPVKPLATGTPLVSVCICHYNRPHYLAQALHSVRAQDYPNIEVIVVDDGSTKPEALAYLDKLRPEFAARGWQIVSQENRYPGAARNNASRHAKGEYLLFLDDDNIANPNAVSRFVGAALHGGADIISCFSDIFIGSEPPRPGQEPVHRWLYLGDAIGPGVLYNTFGDTFALIRREVFVALGGFTEDYGCSSEDKELFTKAVFRGYRLEVLPEALFWYRESPQGVNLGNPLHRSRMRGLRPYRDELPSELQNVFTYALSHYLRGLESPAAVASGSPSPFAVPLRYRIADRVNNALLRFAPAHRAARSALVKLVSAKKAMGRRRAAVAGAVPRPKSLSVAGRKVRGRSETT